MGLFGQTRTSVETPKFETKTESVRAVRSPEELLDQTRILQIEITRLLEGYNELLEEGMNLSLKDYRSTISVFESLAHTFEKVYELMRFDLERQESIEEYNKQVAKKRAELLRQLEKDEEPEKAGSEPEPKVNQSKKG